MVPILAVSGMAEVLHLLRCMKPFKNRGKKNYLSTGAGYQSSTVSPSATVTNKKLDLITIQPIKKNTAGYLPAKPCPPPLFKALPQTIKNWPRSRHSSGCASWSKKTLQNNNLIQTRGKKYFTLRIMESQQWWFGDARTLRKTESNPSREGCNDP